MARIDGLVLFAALGAALAAPGGCHRDGPGASQSGAGARDARAHAPEATPDAAAPAASADDARAAAADAEPAAPATPPDLEPTAACEEPEAVRIFITPRRPMDDVPIRVMVVTDREIPGAALWARTPRGEVRRLDARHFRGPPFAWSAVIEEPGRGTWRIALATGERIHSCEDVSLRVVRASRNVTDVVWPVEADWDRAFENLYSAWIMQLFDSPPGERPSWRPLHEVLRDPHRNFLYNRLGLDEDGPNPREAVRATPDCADTPYYLRAYFAWKMRLPFVFSSCSRGTDGEAPVCGRPSSNLEVPLEGLQREGVVPEGLDEEGLRDAGVLAPDQELVSLARPISEVVAFDAFVNERVVRTVASGGGRTMPGDDRSDFYPIELSRESIRPGTVFVDPYGHLLVVSQWVDQTDGGAGMLFAVDGHPDLSIGRKRFWQGAFLFVDDLSWGAGGFKAFRPVEAERRNGEWRIRVLDNAAIDADPDYGNYSDEQYRLGTRGFYERMDRIINPRPLEPLAAQRAMLDAFYELVQERVDSVVAGEEYMARRRYEPIDMPDGPEIFETMGPWEDYSTPARDMRLLIAIDLVLGFPDRVVERPGSFALSPSEAPAAAAARLRTAEEAFLSSHHVSYVRSSSRETRLSLAEVIGRRRALEVGYNPNDCIEVRWGAPEGSEERSSCRRAAPEEQRERMAIYREWFRTRRRPPRR